MKRFLLTTCILIVLLTVLCSQTFAAYDTLDEIIGAIGGEPSNTENYVKAAELYNTGGESGYKVFCDGTIIDFGLYDNVQPVNENGSTMVPARALAESMAGVVDWDPALRLITIEMGGNTIKLTLDSKFAVVNESQVAMDVPAKTINGRTMIPLRFVSQNFGKQVGYYPNGNVKVISVSN